MKIITFNILIEFSCLLTALFCLRKDKGVWPSFCWFLLYTVLTELTGRFLAIHQQRNQWVYNIYLIVEAGFISYVFWKFSTKFNVAKSPFIWAVILFVLVYMAESLQKGLLRFHSLSNTVLSMSIVIFCFRYYSLLLSDSGFFNLKKMPEFWWVTGCLFYYFGSTSANLIFDWLSVQNSLAVTIPVRYYILNMLIFILYSCWSYAFICKYRIRKSLSSSY